MCCFNNFAPGPGATMIAELKPGDQITLLPNYGDPRSDEERILIIVSVSGFSALCHDGTTLAGIRNDGYGITIIGNVAPEEVVISEKAQELLRDAEVRQSLRQLKEEAIERLFEDEPFVPYNHKIGPADGWLPGHYNYLYESHLTTGNYQNPS
jgi:hypothetical protein